jgi:hypothetical protein
MAPDERLSNRVDTVRSTFGEIVAIALRSQSKAAREGQDP